MSIPEAPDTLTICDQLRSATALTPRLMADIVELACRRFPSAGHPDKTARIKQMIEAQAWTDATLALIDLELPSWHVRRIAYDSGEWYCALSHERELPDWLDQSVEGRHAVLALAIVSAFAEVQIAAAEHSEPGIPAVPRDPRAAYVALCSENLR